MKDEGKGTMLSGRLTAAVFAALLVGASLASYSEPAGELDGYVVGD